MLTRRSTARKPLADPPASCGRQINTSWIRRKKAWWACGPALEQFDKEIEDDLANILQHLGLGYADIYVRLYMIGREQSKATPTIMVCCTNAVVRKEAEDAIRRSNMLDKYPEFGLGSSPLPLEQPTRARALAGTLELPETLPAELVGNAVVQSIFPLDELKGISTSQAVGRRICAVDDTGRPSRFATGGVIVQIGDEHYQIVPGHIDDPEEPEAVSSSIEYDECHFDGDSDGDSDDEEAREETEGPEWTALRTASLSSGSRGSSPLASVRDDADSDIRSIFSSPTRPGSPDPAAWNMSTEPGSSSGNKAHMLPLVRRVPKEAMTTHGRLQHSIRDGQKSSLDYALIRVNNLDDLEHANSILLNDRSSLQICAPAPIGDKDRKVIVVTASGGVGQGLLIHGATYFRSKSSPALQKIYVLQLDGIVVEGDCGAVVINEDTGELYGHIVRGCSGTGVAYVVSSLEVFDDIRRNFGKEVLVAKPIPNLSWGTSLHTTNLEATTSSQTKSQISHRCGETSKRRGDPEWHLLSHGQKEPYTCLQCGQGFMGRQSLRLHWKLHKDEKAHRCSKCKRKFPHRDALARHGEVPDGCAGRWPSVGSFEAKINHDKQAYRDKSRQKSNATVVEGRPSTPKRIPRSLAQDIFASNIFSNSGFALFQKASDAEATASRDTIPRAPGMELAGSPSDHNDAPYPRSVASASVAELSWDAYPSGRQLNKDESTLLTQLSLFGTPHELSGVGGLGLANSPSDHSPSLDYGALDTTGCIPGDPFGDSGVPKRRRLPCPFLLSPGTATYDNRPEKCPVSTCEYAAKGFIKKYDRNRHVLTHYKSTMVCGFCPGAGSSTEKSFNRADVFKRHLTATHGVVQRPVGSRRKIDSALSKKPSRGPPDATGRCSTCDRVFADPQRFYEHLDDCILRIIEQPHGIKDKDKTPDSSRPQPRTATPTCLPECPLDLPSPGDDLQPSDRCREQLRSGFVDRDHKETDYELRQLQGLDLSLAHRLIKCGEFRMAAYSFAEVPVKCSVIDDSYLYPQGIARFDASPSEPSFLPTPRVTPETAARLGSGYPESGEAGRLLLDLDGQVNDLDWPDAGSKPCDTETLIHALEYPGACCSALLKGDTLDDERPASRSSTHQRDSCCAHLKTR